MLGACTATDCSPGRKRFSPLKSSSGLLALVGAVALASAPSDARSQTAEPVCDGALGYSASFGGRRTFLWRQDWLEAAKAGQNQPAFAPARAAMMARAEGALTRGPYVVVDKTQTPASGDKHDYMSLGPYWWPDPTQPGGMPYLRRDGQVNSERSTDAFDHRDLSDLSADIQALSMAWYFTEDPRFADQAARLLTAWFLNPETRMNPNFNHGQAVPGRSSGRAEGVIDAARLVGVVESLGLLDTSTALTDQERLALRDWFADLVLWMATSDIGRAEQAARNNHGIYYDMLIAHFSLYAGLDDVAQRIAERFKLQRIAAQVATDGSLPLELERTRSLHYTTFTLTAALDMAQIGHCVDVDLKSFVTDDGRSLRAAVNFVAEWAGREAEWPYPESNKAQTAGLYEVMRRGAWAWSDPELEAKAALYAEQYRNLPLNLRLPAFAR